MKAAVQIADVQSSDVPAEAGSADEQTADEFSDNSEAQDAAAVQNSGEAQNAEPADAATGTEGTDAAGTAEVTSLKDDYYTIADGIVAITTRNETGTNHTGYYLFDENGYLVIISHLQTAALPPHIKNTKAKAQHWYLGRLQ